MPAPQGMVDALNAMREVIIKDNHMYHQYIPAITADSDISTYAVPILKYKEVENAFMSQLINRIVETRIEMVYFDNPLRVLMGDRMPVGYAGQSIYVNPATPQQYNPNDLVGLLEKYEAKVKVHYYELNSDLQYAVTVTRHELKKAFTSWEMLDSFIDGIVQSLYNGAYINEFRLTKKLVSAAYNNYNTPVIKVDGVTTESQAKNFLTNARSLYKMFQFPSTEYNGWSVAGDGDPITTWTNSDRIVFVVRADIMAYLDVNVLAAAFHIDSAKLLGRIIEVDNFDVYDDNGKKIYDGSNILGIMADETWFRIKESDFYLDMFYNAKSRTWSYFLNDTKLFSQNLFSNGVIFATALPTIEAKGLSFGTDSVNVAVGGKEDLEVTVFPAGATTEITFTSSDTATFTVANGTVNNTCKITGVKAGTATLTATAGKVSTTLQVNVTAAA